MAQIDEALKPHEGEGIKQWVGRIRQDNSPKVTVDLLRDAGWPHVNLHNWSDAKLVLNWLQENVGSPNYIWISSDFYFNSDNDAMMFKLRWIGEGT